MQFQQNCLTDGKNQETFQYFKETAAAISLEVEGANILSMQYDKIKQVSEDTVLASYSRASGDGKNTDDPEYHRQCCPQWKNCGGCLQQQFRNA